MSHKGDESRCFPDGLMLVVLRGVEIEVDGVNVRAVGLHPLS
jgi:hypothetical protein